MLEIIREEPSLYKTLIINMIKMGKFQLDSNPHSKPNKLSINMKKGFLNKRIKKKVLMMNLDL